MSDRPTPVPLCDVNAQYRALQPEIDAAVMRVVSSGLAINGPDVAAFEKEAAAYCGAKHAIGCANGTDAILLALAALDVGPGDEVIIPPFTFFATLGSVLRTGATPVFAEVQPDTFNLDPIEVEAKITPRTKAIIPVHLFGQCADMSALQAIAEQHNLHIVEDAAQSFGAEYRGQKCGSFGSINSFSFYPSKNLGTLGDAGMVTTNDDALAKKLFAFRNHGSEVKYFHKYVGWNARLDTIHAAILRAKLPHVDGWIDGRRAAAARYDELISGFGIAGFFRRPIAKPDRKHTYNQYTVRVAPRDRDDLVKFLRDNAIGCDIYYPLPLHLQECVKHLGHREGDFPVSEEASRGVLSLPMFPEITAEQQRRVVERCATFTEQRARRAA
ncbi:DegT/DnrJ/EryC1/StrS family aminotransferase [Limnoglobus roseus]|uniref:DegT/DnrJ/EryC1/StrS family aminotransferase n=1 Tax=Limnoglobus roseus TaxID=2598579 RepID=A0A5C1A867_9BACT|nr:DegT/DnrJ/EryC1/StrS family aminotransferase [Limnoglobus roseus]QEL14940.1 DegT/DnrJ/EryC1/StrS family aminotransferase [Limnoglobus roseus]